MKKALISFALFLSTTAGTAPAGPSNLPTSIPQETPAMRRATPRPYALTGERSRREVRYVTITGGNGGSVAIPFWVVAR
jgi:hypothetical protein